jgi:hypothetical protein
LQHYWGKLIVDDLDNQDRLWEALTATRELIPAKDPDYSGYTSDHPSDWAFYRRSGGNDIVYYNADGKRHRLFGPAYESPYYNIEKWYKDGELHRVGGPAVIHKLVMCWYENGLRHRLDGPAVVNPAGPKQYWINGQKLPPKEYKREIARRHRKGLIK